MDTKSLFLNGVEIIRSVNLVSIFLNNKKLKKNIKFDLKDISNEYDI